MISSRRKEKSSAIISSCLLFLCLLAGRVIGESPLCRRISSGEHGSLAFATFTLTQSKLTFVESGRTYSGQLKADHRLSQLVEKPESPAPSDSPGSTVWRHTVSFANERQLEVQLADDGRTVKVQVITMKNGKPGDKKIFSHQGEKRRSVLHKVIAQGGKGYAFFEHTKGPKGQPVIGMILLGDLLHRVPKNDKLPPTSSADTYLQFLSNGTLLSPFLSSSSYYVMTHLDDLGSVILIRKVSTMSANEMALFSSQVPVGFLTLDNDVFLLDTSQGVVQVFKYVSDLEKETDGKQVKILAKLPFWRFFHCEEPKEETIDPEGKSTETPIDTVSPDEAPGSFLLWIIAGVFLFTLAMLVSGIIIGYCARRVEQRLDAHQTARFAGFFRRRHRQHSPSTSTRSRRTRHKTKGSRKSPKTPKKKKKKKTGELKTPTEKGWWDSALHPPSSSSRYAPSMVSESGSLYGSTVIGENNKSTRDMATQTWKPLGNFGNEKSTSEGGTSEVTTSGGSNGSDSDDLAKCWAKK